MEKQLRELPIISINLHKAVLQMDMLVPHFIEWSPILWSKGVTSLGKMVRTIEKRRFRGRIRNFFLNSDCSTLHLSHTIRRVAWCIFLLNKKNASRNLSNSMAQPKAQKNSWKIKATLWQSLSYKKFLFLPLKSKPFLLYVTNLRQRLHFSSQFRCKGQTSPQTHLRW